LRKRRFFDLALTADPDNVEALVASAGVDAFEAANAFVTDPTAVFAAAEAKLTKALSSVPDHAGGHLFLGVVEIFTNRAREGIVKCEHALTLDRNLALAHAFIGWGKVFIGRAEETEAHIAEALRLSPRDPLAYFWMSIAGDAKNHLGSSEEAVAWLRRSIEANRNYPFTHFSLAAAFAQVGRLDEAHSAAKAGLALDPKFTIPHRRVLDGDERRPDVSRPNRDLSRRHAQGGGPRIMTAVPYAVLAAFLPSAACAAARRAMGMRKGEHET
jgi:tetratricopeptide (TPR) repeat protein